jgi:hypothetical protein
MKHDHRTGRPLRGSGHSTRTIGVRLTDEEVTALDTHVEKRDEPRAVLIREAMDKAGLFTPARKRG